MKRVIKKKRKNFHSFKLFIISLIIIIIVITVLLKLLPTIKNIEIILNDKNTVLTKEEVLNLSALKIGDKLYKDFRSTIKERIEVNPYVKSVEIYRDLSGKVKIVVDERKQEYNINYAGEYIYIDREGYILEVNSEYNNKPIIIGFSTDFSDLSIGNIKIRLNEQDLLKLEIINNIFNCIKNNEVESKITSVDISDRNNFILNIEDEGKSVQLGDGTDLNTKILYMKEILKKEADHKGTIYMNKDLEDGYVYFKEEY